MQCVRTKENRATICEEKSKEGKALLDSTVTTSYEKPNVMEDSEYEKDTGMLVRPFARFPGSRPLEYECGKDKTTQVAFGFAMVWSSISASSVFPHSRHKNQGKSRILPTVVLI